MNADTEKAIKYLNGSEVLNIDELNRTKVLFYAVKLGDVTLVKSFLDIGCNVYIKNHKNQTPLHVASENGDLEIVKLLLKKGTNVNSKGFRQMNALHLAVNNGDLEIVKECLKYNPNLDATNCDGQTPLILAAWKEHYEIAYLLLNKGCNINMVDNYGQSALRFGVFCGNITFMSRLLLHGANPKIGNVAGYTTMDCMIISNDKEMMKLFLDYSSEHVLNMKNVLGMTMFEFANESAKNLKHLKFTKIAKMIVYKNF